jgi:hypothetical protein
LWGELVGRGEDRVMSEYDLKPTKTAKRREKKGDKKE